jgi:MerR family gold-responsive transcriptional activator of gol and ges genes
MNIGEAARVSGVSAKMIRYYEGIGLLPPADRRDSGYRDYGASDLHRLHFVRRARDLGFPIDTIRELLGLWGSPERPHAEVRAIASRHIEQLKEQARLLESMIGTLQGLVKACASSDRPHCPIIDDLSGGRADAGTRTMAASGGPAAAGRTHHG